MEIMHLEAIFLTMHTWQKCEMVLKELVTLKWWHVLTSFYFNVFWDGHGGSLHSDLSVSLPLPILSNCLYRPFGSSLQPFSRLSLEQLIESWVTQTSWSHLRFLLKLLLLNHFLLCCAHLGCVKCSCGPLSKSVTDFIETMTLVFPVGPKNATLSLSCSFSRLQYDKQMLWC